MRSVRSRTLEDDAAHILEKDFYMSVLCVFLLLVGGAQLSDPEASAGGEGRAPGIVRQLYLEADGSLHPDRRGAPQVEDDELLELLRAGNGAKRDEVLLRLAPRAQGDRICAVLDTVKRATGKSTKVRVLKNPPEKAER